MIRVDFFSQPTKLLLKIIIHSLSCSYCNSYLSYALQSFLSNLKIILTFALHFLCLMNAFFFYLVSPNVLLSLSTGPVRDMWTGRDCIYIHMTLGRCLIYIRTHMHASYMPHVKSLFCRGRGEGMDPLHQSRHSKTKTRQASKYHMHRLSVFLNDGERFPFFFLK